MFRKKVKSSENTERKKINYFRRQAIKSGVHCTVTDDCTRVDLRISPRNQGASFENTIRYCILYSVYYTEWLES